MFAHQTGPAAVALTLALLLVTARCGSSPEPERISAQPAAPFALRLDRRDNGESRRLARGQEMIISLPANPTTNYLWHVEEVDRSVVEQKGVATFDPSRITSGQVGIGGEQVFRFYAVGPGRTTVRMALRRENDDTTPVAKRYEVTITVY
jgi:inhibitor of cysteine peptidase